MEDPRKLRRDDFVLGIFGGSVAMSLALTGGDTLVRRLVERRPELAGSVYVLNMARGGYKQPQQLFLFEQMILLGVPIDVALNLDGFNEVALGATDALQGHHPIYPDRKHLSTAFAFSNGSPSAREIELAADILRQKRHTAELESYLATSPLGLSELARALQGRRIERRGVAFHDLTTMFADHPETLYKDACCHLNDQGNRLLATAVADLVADLLDSQPTQQ